VGIAENLASVQDRLGQNESMARTALALLNRPSLGAPPLDDEAPAFRFVDPATAQLSVLDLGVTRGDGIFESISVAHGTSHALDGHLRRFARSAELLELPIPDLRVWRHAIEAVIDALDPMDEAFVKAVITRGIEGDGRPTGWAYGAPAPDHHLARTVGVRVVSLDRGYRHDIESTSPWLLAGAKSLSYAVNRSVLREAARRGADDVIFVSSDGFVLEGPTSSVLFRRGNFLGTPGTGLGILEGTTQGDLFEWAREKGFATGFEMLSPSELVATDAVWLVSSGRHAAPVRELDGIARSIDESLTRQMNEYLLSRTR
jgi:4-amino-4-deoxychorismate lyase